MRTIIYIGCEAKTSTTCNGNNQPKGFRNMVPHHHAYQGGRDIEIIKMAKATNIPLTPREKAHRAKLVKEYNKLIEQKKEAYTRLMSYEKVLDERNHSG